MSFLVFSAASVDSYLSSRVRSSICRPWMPPVRVDVVDPQLRAGAQLDAELRGGAAERGRLTDDDRLVGDAVLGVDRPGRDDRKRKAREQCRTGESWFPSVVRRRMAGTRSLPTAHERTWGEQKACQYATTAAAGADPTRRAAPVRRLPRSRAPLPRYGGPAALRNGAPGSGRRLRRHQPLVAEPERLARLDAVGVDRDAVDRADLAALRRVEVADALGALAPGR